MTNAIEVRGLCKSYPDFTLDHVDLIVPGGCIMGLIGENGAGKSTTIKALLGILRPDSGEIRLLGSTDAPSSPALRQSIGMVFDEYPFHSCFSPLEIGSIHRRIYRDWDDALYRNYLQKFSLPEKKAAKDFSRGMKMKLSLAAALSHRPKLLLLDEPTSGLDPVVRTDILDEFQAFVSDEDHAILISSHITSDLEHIADYVTFLHRGKVCLSGGKDALLETHGCLRCTSAQLSTVDLAELLGVRRTIYSCEALVRDRSAFTRRHPGLTVDPVTLEEMMVFLAKEDTK